MTTAPHAAVVVVHDFGDAGAGELWREALPRHGWSGLVVAPDLPGHGSAPAPVGGSYEMGDAALAVIPAMRAAHVERPVIVGVGANGWVATVLAIAGEASVLVLVDGLGGPWLTPAEWIAAGVHRARAIAGDPDALGPAPASGLDPRASHGIARVTSRALAEKAADAVPVPVVVVTTPACPLSDAERADLVARFPRGATVIELPDRHAAAVAPALVHHFGRAQADRAS